MEQYVYLISTLILLFLIINLILIIKFKFSAYRYSENLYNDLQKSIVESGAKNRQELSNLNNTTRLLSEENVKTDDLIINNFKNFVKVLGYEILANDTTWNYKKGNKVWSFDKKPIAKNNDKLEKNLSNIIKKNNQNRKVKK